MRRRLGLQRALVSYEAELVRRRPGSSHIRPRSVDRDEIARDNHRPSMTLVVERGSASRSGRPHPNKCRRRFKDPHTYESARPTIRWESSALLVFWVLWAAFGGHSPGVSPLPLQRPIYEPLATVLYDADCLLLSQTLRRSTPNHSLWTHFRIPSGFN
jgi:hypothetical protein